MPTPHIGANPGDFAKVVLMPGDPLRARWIAETFLTDVKLVTEVRGILGFTGYTKNGKRISVMASGMGQPSIGIYSHELYEHYGVEAIIRVGTCGSYAEECDVGSVIIAEGSCTDSNWISQYKLEGGLYSAIADFEMLKAADESAKELGIEAKVGNIVSSDVFYDDDPNMWKKWQHLGVLAVEMESYALYINAAVLKKKALCILTVSDSYISHKVLTAEERQNNLRNMVEIGIRTAEKFA